MRIHTKAPFALVLASVIALGCQSQTSEETGSMEDETAPAAAPDVAAIQSAIEASDDAWEAAALAGDAAALTALYTDDATLLPPDMPMARGSAEIRSAFDAMLGAVSFESMELASGDAHVAESGDLAYVVGTYHDVGTTADGAAFDESGKYAVVYRNVDGQWKIASDTWNSDGMAPAAE